MRIEYCTEMIKKINEGYPISPDAYKIGEAAILGMLYEVSTSPSPGLVSPYSKGAHSDMDFFTFLRSTSSIAYIMSICAQIGIDFDIDILKKLRSAGMHAEKNMFKKTGGVNTQRGLLFLCGVVCASAGRCIREGLEMNRDSISMKCREICSGIVDRELKKLNSGGKLTNGERLFLKYGVTGIRGEVENGLPSVLLYGLPAYYDALHAGLDTAGILSHTLAALMAEVADTTVLNRCGIEGLEIMKAYGRKAMELGGMKTSGGREYINSMDNIFTEKNISPGGAADLLAATVMIYELEKN